MSAVEDARIAAIFAADYLGEDIDNACDEALEEVRKDTNRRLAALCLADYSRNGGTLVGLVRAYS